MFQKFLNYFDFYDVYFRDKFLKTKNGKTIFGSFIGILYVLLMLTISGFLSYTFSSIKETVSIVQHEDSFKIPENDISNTPIMLTLIDKLGNPIPSESLYSLTFLYKRTFHAKLSDGSVKMNMTVVDIKLEDCYKFKDDPNLYKLKNLSGYFNLSKCLMPNNTTNLILSGKWGDTSNSFSMIQIILNKCDSSREKCLDDSAAQKLVSGGFFAITYVNSYIDVYNSNPYGLKVETQLFPISFSIRKRFAWYISQINFFSDEGWFFKNIKSFNFFKSNNIFLDIDDSEKNEFTGLPFYLAVAIRNTEMITNYFRSFQKLPQLLAGISSMSNLLMIISKHLVGFFTYETTVLGISNSLFSFEKKVNQNKIIMIKNQNQGESPNDRNKSIQNFSIKFNRDEKIHLKFKDFLIMKFCCKSNKTTNIFKKSEEFIKEKLSFESILMQNIQLFKYINNENCENENEFTFNRMKYFQLEAMMKPESNEKLEGSKLNLNIP